MTYQTPIERAAKAIVHEPCKFCDWENETKCVYCFRDGEDAARESFESIDTGQLARIIHPGYGRPRHDLPEEQPCLACKRAHHIALAVKNWLTGKDE